MNKGLSIQATDKILKDYHSKKIIDAFLEVREDEEDLSQKNPRDEDIEDINRYRKIKKNLDKES